MPRWIVYLVVVLLVLSWIPLVMIARARYVKSEQPRTHIIPDMDNQQRYKPQQRNPLFADRRAMRPQVEGTVARGDLRDDVVLYRGISNGDDATSWVEDIPVPVTMQTMRRGRQRFEIFCSPCHGLAGDGRGTVSIRAEELQ